MAPPLLQGSRLACATKLYWWPNTPVILERIGRSKLDDATRRCIIDDGLLRIVLLKFRLVYYYFYSVLIVNQIIFF